MAQPAEKPNKHQKKSASTSTTGNKQKTNKRKQHFSDWAPDEKQGAFDLLHNLKNKIKKGDPTRKPDRTHF